MALTDKQYKELSIKEFTQAAERYEGDQGGINHVAVFDTEGYVPGYAKSPIK